MWLLKKTSFLFYKLLLKLTCVLFVFEEFVSEVVYQLYKMMRMRKNVLKEILQTEEEYVEDLNILRVSLGLFFFFFLQKKWTSIFSL